MTNIQILIIAFWLALCFGGRLLASENVSDPRETRLSVKSFGVESSKVGDGSAAYSLAGVWLELERCHWQLGVGRQWFDWENSADFVEDTGGETPWDNFTRLQVGFAQTHRLSDRWSGEILAGITCEFEEELDDSFAAYLGGYGLYQVNSRLMWMIGMFYSRHQEIKTDFDFVPIVGMAWNPGVNQGFSAQLGLPVTRATWHFTSKTRMVLDFTTIEGGVARLADDSSVRPGGYAERISASLALRLETRIGDDVEFSAGIGHSLHRELKLYDSDGGNERSHDIEKGMGIEISISKVF